MSDSTVRIVSWNMAHKQDSWRYLLDMEYDLALLQEACRPPDDIAEKVDIDPVLWPASERDSRVKWRSAIAVLSERVAVEWLNAEPIGRAPYGHLAVSSPGTLTAARVRPRSGEPFIAVSMYAELESPLEGELDFFRFLSPPAGFGSGGVRRTATRTPDCCRGRLEPDARLQRGREPVLGRALPDRLRPYGGHGVALHRAAVPQRQTGRAMAGAAAERQLECSYLAPAGTVSGRGESPA